MSPLISIIVPVYNVEKYLSKCLDSLLRQTISDCEIICVNDGSTDRSLDILQDYAMRDDRITIISQENAGLGAARNAGIRAARGTYLGFIDSDDFADCSLFEKAVNCAEKNKSDVVIFNAYLYFTDSCRKTVFRDAEFYRLLEEEEYFTAVEHPKIINSIGVWDKIYRKDFILSNGIMNPESRIYEDVLFTVKALTMAKRISVISEPLIYYRKNTGTSIVDKEVVTDYYKFDFLKNLRESKEFLTSMGLYSHFQKDFLYFQSIGIMFHQNNMQTKGSYIEFEKILSEILDDSDYDILKAFELDGVHNGIQKYMYRLKHKRFLLQYCICKLKRLYKIDPWHISFRFPRMARYFKIKRIGFNKTVQNEYLKNIVYELVRLNTEITSLPKQQKVANIDE